MLTAFFLDCSFLGTQEKKDGYLLEQTMGKLASMTFSQTSKSVLTPFRCFFLLFFMVLSLFFMLGETDYRGEREGGSIEKSETGPFVLLRLLTGLLRYRAPITEKRCTRWPGAPRSPRCHLVSVTPELWGTSVNFPTK